MGRASPLYEQSESRIVINAKASAEGTVQHILLDSFGVKKPLPADFIKSEENRASFKLRDVADQIQFPIIDMQSLSRAEIVAAVGKACEEWGFFQIVNHGLEQDKVDRLQRLATEFFNLPLQEKREANRNNQKVGLYNPVFYGRQLRNDWSDLLKITVFPEQAADYANWPENPPDFSSALKEQANVEKALFAKLAGIICESLGLEENYFADEYAETASVMVFNYYPPSPEPELTVGIGAHKDPNFMTLLFEGDLGGGLQVFKDDAWHSVPSTPNSIIVNVANQLQIMSNGKYKSVLHQVPSHPTEVRTSRVSFMSPLPSATIKPAAKLLDENNTARYPEVTVAYCHHAGGWKNYGNFLDHLESQKKVDEGSTNAVAAP